MLKRFAVLVALALPFLLPAIAHAQPVNTAKPVVSGAATQGDVLTTTNGSWTGTVTKYKYSWYDCNGTCVAVSGATSASYTLQASDVGFKIRSGVQACNAKCSAVVKSAATAVVTASTPPPPPSLTVTHVGTATGNEISYNTFGPWTQHVVYDGSYGIFAVYHTTQSDDSSGCHCGYFRVIRSTDGGSTWSTVYDSQNDDIQVQGPSLDKDASGNIYVTGNNSPGGTWQTYLWKFAAGSFTSPARVLLPYGASKYSMIYDPARGQVDLSLWENDGHPNFVAVDASSLAVVRTVIIWHSRSGQCCSNIYDDVQYSTLSVGPDGKLLLGWSTVDNLLWQNGAGTQNYYDAHFLVSSDGGATWDGPNGQVTLPIFGSDSNSYQIVNTADPNEFEPYGSPSYTGNWNILNTVLWNDGGVAAAYGGFTPQDHASFGYLNSAGQWTNRTDAIKSVEGQGCNTGQQSDGGLSQNPSYTGTIYEMCHSLDGSHVQALYSTDDGATWHNFATSTWSTDDGWVYLSPSHELGPNGQLGALFTVVTAPGSSADVYFVHSG